MDACVRACVRACVCGWCVLQPKSSLSPSNRGAFAKRSPPPPPPVRPLNPGPAAAGTMPSPTARSGGNTKDDLAALDAEAQPVEHDLLGSGSEDEEEPRNTSSGGAAAAAASSGDANDTGSGAESGDQVGDMQAAPREPRRRSYVVEAACVNLAVAARGDTHVSGVVVLTACHAPHLPMSWHAAP